MSWGSFLCGLIVGAVAFGTFGIFLGWLFHLVLKPRTSDECASFRLLLTKLKRGSSIHLSISSVDDDDDFRRDNGGDDDDGDSPTTNPSYDWSRN